MKADDFVVGWDEYANGDSENIYQQHTGLTVRDHIAIEAMKGELSSQSEEMGEWGNKVLPTLAERCYKIADAMIAESNKS